MTSTNVRLPVAAAAVVASVALLTAPTSAQQRPPRRAENARATAPIDITGYWVSVVSEDWLQRMLMPPRGDYAGVPLTVEGRGVANQWEPAKQPTDGCRPYGAAGLMRVPGRLHITWENDTTLKIETDAGQQTRLLRFGIAPGPAVGRPTERTWQGNSAASWEQLQQFGGTAVGLAPPAPRIGSLKVVTTSMRSAYLRRNGVSYSEDAVLTEFFDRVTEDGTDWLVVQTTVEDPRYLTQPFLTSTHFQREPDGSKWAPTPCETAPARASR